MKGHGTETRYTYHLCRCDRCTQAHRRAQARYRRARYRKRIRMGGVLVAPLPGDRHGLASTYGNWGCRCPLCHEAAMEAFRKQREKNAR